MGTLLDCAVLGLSILMESFGEIKSEMFCLVLSFKIMLEKRESFGLEAF